MSRVVLLVLSSILPGSAGLAVGPQVDVEVARELLRRGDYGEAGELIEELVEGGEEQIPLLLLNARLLRETGRGKAAMDMLVATRAYGEHHPDVLAWIGRLELERGNPKAAERTLERALKKDSEHIAARTLLGLSLIRRGERVRGRAHLQKVRDFYRGLSRQEAQAVSPEDYVWMGRACQDLDRFREAYEVMYDSALDLDKGSPSAHLASGHILLSKYNYPDARSHFKDALKTNPNLAEAHVGLALATFLDHQYPGSRFRETQRALDSADFTWKDHPGTLRIRGHLAFYDEDWQAAEGYYKQALVQDETNLEGRALVAAVYYATHRLEEFNRECQVAESTPLAAAVFYTALANKLVERFFYAEGAEFARKAVKFDPDYWPAFVPLGINALRMGEEEEGREWIEKAFAADPFNVWALNTKRLIRHIDKNFSESVSDDFVIRMRREDKPFLLPYLSALLQRSKVDFERRYKMKIETPVTVEDFSKHQYFSARSIGLPGLAASGVCFGRMMTLTTPKAIPGNWGAVAIHELAHIVTLQKTGNRVPRWLTEGLSVFEEGSTTERWKRRYPDEFVEAVHHGELLPMARIQGAFTKPSYPAQIMLAYYQGGVISRFITETYGFDKIVSMLDLYRVGKSTEEVLQAVLGKSLDAFDKEFFEFARSEADALGIWPRYLHRQIGALRELTEDHPENVEAWIKLGLAYFFTGKLTDAELVIGQALGLRRDHPDLAALMGFVKMVQKKNTAAIADLENAIAGKTNYRYRARVALAILYGGENDRDRAIRLLREAIEIHPDGVRPRFGNPSPYYQLANLLFADDKEAEAIEVLEQLANVDRDDVKVRIRLGNYYKIKGDWERVAYVLGDGVYIDPYDQEIHRLLAEAYLETESYKKALVELTVLLEEESPPLQRLYPDIAWCHHKLGSREQALDFARRALKMDPENERAKQVIEESGE